MRVMSRKYAQHLRDVIFVRNYKAAQISDYSEY